MILDMAAATAVLKHYYGRHPYSCQCLLPYQLRALKARLVAKYRGGRA